MGLFINITLDDRQLNSNQARTLVSLCPVDIFQLEGDRLRIQADQVDECTLCQLCLDAVPAGALRIEKIYTSEVLVSRGASQ